MINRLMIKGLRGLILGGALLTAGCAFTPPGMLAPQGAGPMAGTERIVATVGRNSQGETCRLMADPVPVVSDDGVRQFVVQCGEWPTPSAWILAGPVDAPVGPDSIYWSRTVGETALCEPGRPSRFLGSNSATTYSCRRKGAGWPIFAMSVQAPGGTYLTHGIPVAGAPVERAIGYLSGQVSEAALRDSEDRDRSAAQSRAFADLEAEFGDRAYDAGDIGRYEQLLDLAQYYNSIGNYPASAQFYRNALTVLERFMDETDSAFADPTMRLALALSSQGNFRDADEVFAQAAALAPSDFDRMSPVRLQVYQATHLGHQGKCEQGLQLLKSAERRLRALANEGGQGTELAVLRGSLAGAGVELALLKAVEASFHMCLRDLERAEAMLDRAVADMRALPGTPPGWEPIFQSLRAEILRRRSEFGTGDAALADAIADRERLFDPSRPEALDRLYRGEMLALRGNREAAIASYDRGVAILLENDDSVSLEQVMPYFKLLFEQARETPNERQRIYRHMFDIGQLVRTNTTAQTIAKVAAQLASGDDRAAELVRSMLELGRQINDLNLAIDKAQTRVDAEARRTEISTMLAERDALRRQRLEISAEVQSALPQFQQLVMKPLPVDEVIDLLQGDEALLQVLLGEEESIAFLVTKQNGVRPIFRQTGRSEVKHAVDELRRGLTIRRSDRVLSKFDVGLSYALYASFIEPFESELADKEHLIAVPSGPLLSLPFGVLAKKPVRVTNNDYRGVPWLGTSIAISTVPSARNLADLRKRARTGLVAPEPFLGFGDFNPGTRLETDLGQRCEDRRAWMVNRADPLPETRQELEAVARALRVPFNQSVRLGRDFTEAAVRGTALDQYRMIYFATHGIVPADEGCLDEPALIATPGIRSSSQDDGLLTMTEIMTLKLRADMVVLSACNTGGGDGTGGESLSGLARAFFWATARSLLVSHWYTESAATRDLMREVFEIQAANTSLGMAEVMKRAQQDIMNSDAGQFTTYRSHPAFWGAFTFIGDGYQPIRFDTLAE